MSSVDIVLIVLSATTAIFGGGWLFGKVKALDDQIEKRRATAVHLAATLFDVGLDRGAEIAKAYAIGDYDGMYWLLHDVARELLDPELSAAMLDKAFRKTLPARIANDEQRERIRAALFDFDAIKAVRAVQRPAAKPAVVPPPA